MERPKYSILNELSPLDKEGPKTWELFFKSRKRLIRESEARVEAQLQKERESHLDVRLQKERESREQGTIPTPQEDEKHTRRAIVKKGLRYIKNGGLVIAGASVLDMVIQTVDTGVKSMKVEESHPSATLEELEKAYEIKREQDAHGDLPARKTKWAQQIFSKEEAHDEEFARRYPNTFSRGKADIIGLGVGGGLASASKIVDYATDQIPKILSRREFLRGIRSQNSIGKNTK